jgi:hypothetical protein
MIKACFVLAPLCIIPIVSRVGDAGHVFHAEEYVERIAKEIRVGYNVTGVEDLDQRLLQAAIVRDIRKEPDLVVLGSSRAMIMSSVLLGRPLMNTAMSGASIDDLFAAYQFYRKRGFHPRTILLCLDPWMLNEHYADRRWRSVAPDVEAMRRTLGLTEDSAHNPMADVESMITDLLLSRDYFKASLRQLMRRAKDQESLHTTHQAANVEMTRLADGAIVYGASRRERTAAAALADAKDYLTMDPIYGFQGFTSITDRRGEEMRRFLQLMRADGSDVRIIMMPYHPLVYRTLARTNRFVRIGEIERVVRTLALETGVSVSGSYSPAAVGLGPADFLDGMHPRDEPSAAIAKAALTARY